MVISEKSISLVGVILMHAFLLQAKSLRNAENSRLSSDQPEVNIQAPKRTTGSSCSPDINQLDVLLQLYGARGSVSNFNGNTMNYALKAEQSRSEPTTTTVKDNELVENFDDQKQVYTCWYGFSQQSSLCKNSARVGCRSKLYFQHSSLWMGLLL